MGANVPCASPTFVSDMFIAWFVHKVFVPFLDTVQVDDVAAIDDVKLFCTKALTVFELPEDESPARVIMQTIVDMESALRACRAAASITITPDTDLADFEDLKLQRVCNTGDKLAI